MAIKKDTDAIKFHQLVSKDKVKLYYSGERELRILDHPTYGTYDFNEEDSSQLAHWICDVLESIAIDENDVTVINEVKAKVTEICSRLPVYK